MPAGGKGTARSIRLGSTLRRLRIDAGLDQEAAADAVNCSIAKISRIESGSVTARVGDVRILLDLYGVTDQAFRQRQEWLARNSNKRGWWLDYRTNTETKLGDLIALEEDATYIRTWQCAVVPGLLQTPGYTRALIGANPSLRTPEAVEEVVTVRQERATRVLQQSSTRFAAVIWEPALTAPMPSPADQQEQLAHLLRVAQLPQVTIQVLPLTEWAAGTTSPPFVAFSFNQSASPDVVVADTMSSVAVIENEHELANYSHAYDTLRSAALTPRATTEFLRKTMNDLAEKADQP